MGEQSHISSDKRGLWPTLQWSVKGGTGREEMGVGIEFGLQLRHENLWRGGRGRVGEGVGTKKEQI